MVRIVGYLLSFVLTRKYIQILWVVKWSSPCMYREGEPLMQALFNKSCLSRSSELWEDARTGAEVPRGTFRRCVNTTHVTTTLGLSFEAVGAAGLGGSWSLWEGLENVLTGQLGLLWLGTMFSGKAEETWEISKVMSPKKSVFSLTASHLNASSYDVWSSPHNSIRATRPWTTKDESHLFKKIFVIDKKLGKAWLSCPS